MKDGAEHRRHATASAQGNAGGCKCPSVHWGVVATAALTLSIPDGYSLGAVWLLLAAIICLFRSGCPSFPPAVTLYVLASATYFMLWVTGAVRDDLGVSALDQPSRFIFAIPVVLALWNIDALRLSTWVAVVVSCVGAAGWAFWQVVLLGLPRADGIANTENFGLVCAVFFGFALSGALWGALKNKPSAFITLMLLGAVAALVGLALSGTRAAWVGAFGVIPLFLVTLLKLKRFKAAGVAVSVGVLMAAAAYSIPQTGLSDRVGKTVADLSGFGAETYYGSVGRRFEAWRGAISLWQESPLVGVGEHGFRTGMEELAAAGFVEPSVSGFRHAHNDWLDMLAKHGPAGLLVLMAIYGVPLVIFLRGFYVAHSPEVLVASVAGLSLVGNFVMFSMAHQALGSNIGIMTYAFWVPVLIGGVLGGSVTGFHVHSAKPSGGAGD